MSERYYLTWSTNILASFFVVDAAMTTARGKNLLTVSFADLASMSPGLLFAIGVLSLIVFRLFAEGLRTFPLVSGAVSLVLEKGGEFLDWSLGKLFKWVGINLGGPTEDQLRWKARERSEDRDRHSVSASRLHAWAVRTNNQVAEAAYKDWSAACEAREARRRDWFHFIVALIWFALTPGSTFSTAVAWCEVAPKLIWLCIFTAMIVLGLGAWAIGIRDALYLNIDSEEFRVPISDHGLKTELAE